jgi:hypothetical protein
MKKIINPGLAITILVLITLVFAGCKKTDTPLRNNAPIAKAGKDTAIFLPPNSILLDGSASADADNNIASYLWKLVAGTSIFTITKPDSAKMKMENLVQGIYHFELTVTDKGGLSSKDTVQVIVGDLTIIDGAVILRNQKWDYSWITEIDIFNAYSYLPANSHIKNIFIKRDFSTEWEWVVPLALYPDYSRYTYQFGNDILAIFPDDNSFNPIIDDTPDIKIEY